MEAKTKEQLLIEYPDHEVRDNLFRLRSLSDLLSMCIISDSYKVPAHVHEAITLTSHGDGIFRQLIRKRIPFGESRLMCFLELAGSDLLIDPEMNSKAIAAAIGREIQEGSILYPFIFGRTLYDKAFDEMDLPDEGGQLSTTKTINLLRDTPQGVFQVHSYVTGPFGLLESEQLRFYYPDRNIPLKHCSDSHCQVIHEVDLTTGHEAAVNRHRSEIKRILKKDEENSGAWFEFLNQIFLERFNPVRDNVGDPLVAVLGDCLTEPELVSLAEWLLDQTKGRLRAVCNGLALVGKASDIARGLNRAQLMQLCLTMSDRDIINGIDSLVFSGDILIPADEIRRPVVNKDVSFGRLRLRAEIGSKGLRIMSRSMNVAPLRLHNLIESMYRMDSTEDREELEWQLRSESVDGLEARLERYLQNQSPNSVVKSLVLARKSNAVTACEVLGLREGATDDPDFISLVLWKLGFASLLKDDPHADFWRLHEEMDRMARSGSGGPSLASAEKFRGVAANYFVALENLLTDSLTFTVWALTGDHFASGQPFVFRPSADVPASFSWLQEAASRSGAVLEFSGKTSLHGLCRGFQLLAGELKVLWRSREMNLRSEDEVPRWASQQPLQRFPFLHKVPFLDLTDGSRATTLSQLQEISRILVSNNISEDRNSWLHGGRAAADFDSVRSSLEAIRSAVNIVEDCGFARLSYAVSSRTIDGYGRDVVTLESPRGISLSMHEPSHYDWLNLPGPGMALHIMTAACFASPGQFLRFQSKSSSSYSEFWSNFPRRKPKSRYLKSDVWEASIPEQISKG